MPNGVFIVVGRTVYYDGYIVATLEPAGEQWGTPAKVIAAARTALHRLNTGDDFEAYSGDVDIATAVNLGYSCPNGHGHDAWIIDGDGEGRYQAMCSVCDGPLGVHVAPLPSDVLAAIARKEDEEN